MAQVSELFAGKVQQKPQQLNQKDYEEIPVLYLWFGKRVPEDYLISLSQLNYPIIFLKNPKIERKFSRQLFDIQKSDYYRLWYLYEHGGLYSDFDNTIDYPCLMNLLEPFRTQDKLIFMTDNRHTRLKTQQITTNLIFAPYPKMPILKKMLDSIDETKERVWQFAGIKFVGQFQEPIQMEMNQCVYHSYDWSWFQASNEVLELNSQAHPKYAKKLQKKQDLIVKKQELQGKLIQQRSYSEYLQSEIIKKSHQNAQYRQQVIQVHKKVLKVCPKAQQIIQNFKWLNSKGEDQVYAILTNPSAVQNFSNEKNGQQMSLNNQERRQLWRKIYNLEQTNQKLQYEKGIYKMQGYGSILVVFLVLMYLIIVALKNRKNKFKKLYSQEERPAEIDE